MQAKGAFDFARREYVLPTPVAARPQENFLFNASYFACVHQTGNGFSRHTDPAGYSTTVVAGGIEPAYNGTSRLVYIRDDDTGRYWSVGYYPVCVPYSAYEARQGLGYTVIRNTTDNITATWRIFVPTGDEPVEIWTLALANNSRRRRRLSVFAFAELSLESSFGTYGHASYLNGLFSKKAHGVIARKLAMNLPNPYFAAVFISARRPSSMDADKNAFMDQFRTLANPLAVERDRCSGAVASRDPVGAAIHHRVALPAGGSWRNDYVAGAANVHQPEADAARYARKFLGNADRAFAATQKSVHRFLDSVRITTGNAKFDALFSDWVPLLIRWGLVNGRWGMLGYRDIVQQAQGYLPFDHEGLARQRLEQCLRHQFQNGRAVRTFPAVHEDSKMNYSDSALWLVEAVSEYVKETGATSFLQERVPFLDGGDDTVLGHLRRAVTALWQDRGAHGLCRIHHGDWNDSLTHVGRQGRGESVWLTQAFASACLIMAELDRPQPYRQWHRRVTAALNQHAWDGAWYRCAFDDHGQPLGSQRNREGKLFLNMQSWALLSQTVPTSRAATMLRSIRRHLWTPYGYALHQPVYTSRQENIGRLSCLEPGCSENASVYTHGNAFLAVALLKSGRANDAWEVIERILPFNPDNPSRAVIPFQLSNGYGGPQHRSDPGKAQFGWSTGSGAWLHQAVVEHLFGLRRTIAGLTIQPHLPSSWKKCRITRLFRGTRYDVEYRRTGKGQSVTRLVADGIPLAPNSVLPARPGATVRVKVTLG